MNKRLSRPLLLTATFIIVLLSLGNVILHAHRSTPAIVSLKTKALALDVSSLPAPALAIPHLVQSPTPIYANAYIVIDADTNYPLASKNPDQPVEIASTTKIMTALVTIDHGNLDQVVSVSRQAAGVTGSDIHLLTGETMTIRNLLYAALLNSGNDAGWALSEAHGTTDQFVQEMNAKAQALGLRNTLYKDPVGLMDGHSTPRDLAILTRYALTNPVFSEMVKTTKFTIWSADNKYKHDLNNSNRLIQPDQPLYYPPAIGVKTGYTNEAGHCLIAAADYPNGKRYIAVVLHTIESTNDASAKEARKLLLWASQSN